MSQTIRRCVRRAQCEQCSSIKPVLDACDAVVATLHGNPYGLSVADQLEALRMAASELEQQLNHYRRSL